MNGLWGKMSKNSRFIVFFCIPMLMLIEIFLMMILLKLGVI